jgi:hypothetical protein
MTLINNIQILKNGYNHVWESLKSFENNIDKYPFQVLGSRSGLSTLAFTKEGSQKFIHSKYDPQHEAERIISQYDEIEISKYKHILFYGVGLGYHIELFCRKYPNIDFAIYEPNPIVFYHYILNKKLNDLSLSHLNDIYLEQANNDINLFLKHFSSSIRGNILLIVLPSYERLFPVQYQQFITQFLAVIKNEQSSLHTSLAFQKLWTVNSLKNLSETIRTPNIFHDSVQTHFRGKPAILVSAGPSLQEEMENLRFIKENGLAYIFAAGTAVKGLIVNNIYPDAVLSYDPGSNTQYTFAELKEMNIPSIPFIYGTSITHDAIQNYPGPMCHVIISQDSVTPFYCRLNNNQPDFVNDASSIAIVTLQVLAKLGCNPIILVGQNFAFKNNQYHSEGIRYHWNDKLENAVNQSIKNNFLVEDVYGGQVYSDASLKIMCKEMETYIGALSGFQILNTTKGGAKIAGAPFVELESVIREYLNTKVVNEAWFKDASRSYDGKYIIEKCELMQNDYEMIASLIGESEALLKQLNEAANLQDHSEFHDLNRKFDQAVRKILSNEFFYIFLKPMNRVVLDMLQRNLSEIRLEEDITKKIEKINLWFGKFMTECKKDIESIGFVFEQIQSEVLSEVNS